ncbi:MAG: OmpA family protein [Psychroflexus sp.]|nr:OmpA family protein [Psychroflexus sp.]
MRTIKLTAVVLIFTTLNACVSKKKFIAKQDELEQTKDALESAREQNDLLNEDLNSMKNAVADYNSKIKQLQSENSEKLEILDDGAVMNDESKQAMRNTLKNVDSKKLAQAKTLNDSVNLAIAYNIKQALSEDYGSDLDDNMLNVQVSQPVVKITISNKILFSSGSYKVNKKATSLLQRVADMVKKEENMDVMVEGHTDNKKVLRGSNVKDNWDLSSERATAVVRIMESKFNVQGERLIASARSEYVPVAENTTTKGRQRNRRTSIIVIPDVQKFLSLLKSN